MNENQDWIQRLIEEKREREEAVASRGRLADKIRSDAGTLTGRIREAVRRDVERLNREFYGFTALEITEVSDTGFAIEQLRQLPHATMRMRLWSNEHALRYTLSVQDSPGSHPAEREPESIQIIVGQNLDHLRFSKGNKSLSPDDVSRMLLEPVVSVRAADE